VLAVALCGCEGSGTETTTPSAGDASAAALAPPPRDQRESRPGGAADQAAPKQVTPDRVINPKDVVDVVKEEVAGGEAASGGSPLDFLWQSPDPSVVKDEPLNVDVPKGLPSLVAYVPAANRSRRRRWSLASSFTSTRGSRSTAA